jgi:hypothetical protein
MNAKLITGLVASALLLIGGPAFGFDHKAGGGRPAGRAVASAHRSVAVVHHASVAAVRRAPARSFVARRSTAVGKGTYAAANRSRSTNIARGNTSARNSVAFGGHSNYAQNGNGGRKYAFASHNGWNHGQQYYWHNHHYGWYGNGWYIIDPFPYYGFGYDSGNGGNVAVGVQTALSQAGYYQGPIDGIVGPGTSSAIAAYQHDNGLRVTGTITPALVANLGAG